jgi:Tol biopolymer transport system component
MALTSGTKLGPYEIKEPIGAGGMGEVYLARDSRLDRTVAIKVLPEHLSASPEVRARFEREARAASSLNHPNICVLFDVGHQGGVDFLVMEHLEGETLAARLDRGPLPTDELIRIARQIADALDKAHKQGLVHRDLKPGNVMLTKAGAKLLDFGLARSTGLAPDPGSVSRSPTMSRPLTAEGTIVGTYQYMAPEVLEGREADARSDIFAFGAMLFEMATGKRAFEGKSQASVIAAILEREPPPISTIQPLAPPGLDRLIKTCLAKDPDQRRQSMHDVLLDLQWIAEGGSQAGVPAAVAARRKGTARLAWGIAGAAAIAALAFAVGYFARRPQTPPIMRFTITTPTSSGDVGSPKVSPDGQYIAFTGTDSSGVLSVWLRPMDALVARPIPGTEGALRPFWSPDSKYIAFFANGKLKKIAVSGGPAQTLCEFPGGADGSWGRGGVILFDAGPRDSVGRVSEAGGVPSQATVLDHAHGEIGTAWPCFLPDGKHFLYLGLTQRGDSSILKVGSLDSKETKVLATGPFSRVEYVPQGYVVFARERALMARPFDTRKLVFIGDMFPIADEVFETGNQNADFSLSRTGLMAFRSAVEAGKIRIVWMDRTGKERGTVGDPAPYGMVRLSPDEKRIAAAIGNSYRDMDVWILDPARGTSSRLTFDPASDLWPIWSPDGSRILFTSDRGPQGKYSIFEKPSNGVGQDSMVYRDPNFGVGPVDWSRDGRYVALEVSGTANGWDVWVLPRFGDRKPIPFLHSQFSEFDARFSPDAKWVMYSSNESGRREVYVQAFPGPGGKYQISTQGGRSAKWREDGREILFLSLDGDLMSVDVAPGPDFQPGVPKKLFHGVPPARDPGGLDWAVSRDGQRFLFMKQTDTGAVPTMTVVVNWDAGLKRR